MVSNFQFIGLKLAARPAQGRSEPGCRSVRLTADFQLSTVQAARALRRNPCWGPWRFFDTCFLGWRHGW